MRNKTMVTNVYRLPGQNYYTVGYRLGTTYSVDDWSFCCGPVHYYGLYWVDRGDDELEEDQMDGSPDCSVGNPIDVATGSKYQEFELLNLGNGFYFNAYYQSNIRDGQTAGSSWTTSFDTLLSDIDPLQVMAGSYPAESKVLKTTDRQTIYFSTNQQGGYTALYGKKDAHLSQVMDGDALAGYKYSDNSGTNYFYNTQGKLTKIEDNTQHNVITLTYSDGALSSAIDAYGKSMTFSYGPSLPFSYYTNTLSSIAGSNGITVNLTFNGSNALKKIETVDVLSGTSFVQTNELYSEKYYNQMVNMNDPKALVGIIDESGKNFATWDYDARGLAVYSAHGQLRANGQRFEEYRLSFNADGTTTSTNPFGKESVYHFDIINGVKKVNKVQGNASENCIASNAFYSYDIHGFDDKITDWNGNVTDYDYSELGLLEKITTGLRWANEEKTVTYTTDQTRATEFEWNEDSRKIREIRSLGLTTHHEYWPNNRIKSITQTDTTNASNSFGNANGRTRTWNFSYTYHSGENIPHEVVADS